MGSLGSKPKGQMETPPARPSALRRIEDPRSPTEEISRTPIEVTDRFSKDGSDVNFAYRTAALKEQNKYALDFSPRSRKTEFFGKDFKKLKSAFASALESDATIDMDHTSVGNKVNEKENNEM